MPWYLRAAVLYDLARKVLEIGFFFGREDFKCLLELVEADLAHCGVVLDLLEGDVYVDQGQVLVDEAAVAKKLRELAVVHLLSSGCEALEGFVEF